jgi:cysteine-rich repeat protein
MTSYSWKTAANFLRIALTISLLVAAGCSSQPDPTCTDGIHNGDETDIDCGGGCSPCADSLGCSAPGDCHSQVCESGVCTAPRCGDGVINQAGEVCDEGGPSATCNADCTSATCGDGVVNPAAGEECDEGGVDTASCNANCTSAACGDGFVNAAAGEQCDEGGVDTTTCNADCTSAICGDGVVNPAAGEQCDGGGVDTATCNADCTSAICGDSYTNIAAGEACDQGGVDTATCDADCTPVLCGDSHTNVVAGEACDQGGVDTATCDSDCSPVLCGDYHTNIAAGEACDQGGVDTATCDADCTSVLCGDSYTNVVAGELCDEGGVDTATCDSDCSPVLCGDYHTNVIAGEACDEGGVDTATCDADCTTAVCGDGYINTAAGEECDDGNTLPDDGCDPACRIEGQGAPILIVWDNVTPPTALTDLLTNEGFLHEARNNGAGVYTSDLSELQRFRMVIFYNHDRAISAQEHTALNQYVEQGGKLLVTGYDSMAHPLDTLLSDVSRVITVADYAGQNSCTVTSDSYPPLSGPYGTFPNGMTFTVPHSDHDHVQADAARGAVQLIAVNAAAKLTVAENVGPGDGTVWYWNGNLSAMDWTTAGTARSIFLNLLDHHTTSCAPATALETIGGPHRQYGYCWYLGAAGLTCDQVCAGLGGSNLASSAATSFPDSCSGPTPDDISTWFYENGNPAGWSSIGATGYKTLGFGYVGFAYYGKCASGTTLGHGTFPGDPNNNLLRTLVCPCSSR